MVSKVMGCATYRSDDDGTLTGLTMWAMVLDNGHSDVSVSILGDFRHPGLESSSRTQP